MNFTPCTISRLRKQKSLVTNSICPRSQMKNYCSDTCHKYFSTSISDYLPRERSFLCGYFQDISLHEPDCIYYQPFFNQNFAIWPLTGWLRGTSYDWLINGASHHSCSEVQPDNKKESQIILFKRIYQIQNLFLWTSKGQITQPC